ncbi:MAG: glycosyltransferase family 2 protein [Proteobacteria bacterium]|nr:glycosyltransferase family 2 protein [Pseudomonadota bacterium]
MKLVIQIPCYNEEKTLPGAIADLPREVEGFDEVEYLVINDGSTDRTTEVARDCGVHHLVQFSGNRGLARGFMAGLDACLRVGADVIVNTDADNQYDASFIPALVKPIVDGKADMVIGDRQIDSVSSFSPTKKRLQRFGSWVVRLASASDVPDATSGFRALSREAALSLFVTSEFTYTLETIIQAGAARMKLDAIPIRTHPPVRKSRLFSSMWGYIKRSAGTIVRIYTMYNPLRSFLRVALLFFAIGLLAAGRFLYFFFTTSGPTGHTQSLILAAIMILVAFQIALSGVVADLIGANRKLLESVLRRVRSLEADAAIRSKDEPEVN